MDNETWQAIELLRRQYQQMLESNLVAIPTSNIMRIPAVQARLFETMFKEGCLPYPPPDRYKIRILKKLVESMENAIEDPEEDEISDDLTACLAQLLSQSQVPAILAAQQKCYMTYTIPTPTVDAPTVTLLETPSLIASSGTTGLRTWEAALSLGQFLSSADGRPFVDGKRILELGAGTAFLSILCAKHLHARYVLATDGSEEVIDAVGSNVHLNGFNGDSSIGSAVLKWGHTLVDTILDTHDPRQTYDLVLGADLTYDVSSIPLLVTTYYELFESFPGIRAILSATLRNKRTLEAFTGACYENGLTVQLLKLGVSDQPMIKQIGFFHSTAVPIQILEIMGLAVKRDSHV